MGIQILNKDVSVISGVMGKAKASIGNIFGKTGWNGGGVIVRPDPLPNWEELGTFAGQTDIRQILGINQPINLRLSWNASILETIDSWRGPTNPPTIYQEIYPDIDFTVNPNDYIYFVVGYHSPTTFQEDVIVTNSSDSGAFIDSFTLGYFD